MGSTEEGELFRVVFEGDGVRLETREGSRRGRSWPEMLRDLSVEDDEVPRVLLMADQRVEISGTQAQISEVLASLDCVDAVADEMVDAGEGDSPGYPPFDSGVTVNGEPWGWLAGPDRRWLIPMTFAEDVSYEFTAAYTSDGMPVSTYRFCGLAAPPVSVDWGGDDCVEFLFVCYNLTDARDVGRDIAAGFSLPDGPYCPVCEDWMIIGFDGDPSVEADALASCWRPCAEHNQTRATWTASTEGGHEWSWDGERWQRHGTAERDKPA